MDECVEQLRAHVASGVDRIILIQDRYQPEQIEIIAREIVPRSADAALTLSRPGEPTRSLTAAIERA
ncbi:MAG: hypothetical protein DMD91_06560 [Candidatus Rokuibacteriota bacterium]|nr:MAG: hypothetical protein DMD91_06560 [Candidatus Rokubacteria bacterium]